MRCTKLALLLAAALSLAAQNTPDEPATKGDPTLGSKTVQNYENRSPYRKVFALVVGISHYPKEEDRLKYAESDARKVAAELSDRYGFTATTLLVNEKATREAIFKEITRIGQELDPAKRDDFIFYFSGHGTTATDSKTNRSGFILPHSPDVSLGTKSIAELESKAVPLRSLIDQVRGMSNARHRVMVLDSCFSGLAFKDQKVSSKIPDEAYAEVIAKPTIQLMTAGLEGEFALEDLKLEQSVFTHALLKQLRDPKIRTVEELFFPINVEVRDYFMEKNTGRSMTPQHRYIDLDKGTFVFVPTNRLAGWGNLRSPGHGGLRKQIEGAKGKGADEVQYDGAVTWEEIKRVKYQRYKLTESELRAIQQRFEYRASLGDALAAIGNAEMYRLGLGVKRDPARSRLWEGEASDARDAGLMAKDMETALVALKVFNGGGMNAGNVVGLMELFEKGAVEDFRGALKELQEKLEEKDRKQAVKQHTEVTKIIGEMVRESGGKVSEADVADLRLLVALVGEQIEFGAFNAAVIDLSEADFLLRPIAEKFPKNEKKRSIIPIPGF